LITDLSNQDDAALASVTGVTAQIIGAAVAALRQAYADSFRFVWVTAACFVLCALIGEYQLRNADHCSEVDWGLQL
jgi:hypothetical protein